MFTRSSDTRTPEHVSVSPKSVSFRLCIIHSDSNSKYSPEKMTQSYKQVSLNPKSVIVHPKSVSLNPKSVSLNPKSVIVHPKSVSLKLRKMA